MIKLLRVLFIITICFSMMGCSTVAHIVHMNMAKPTEDGRYEEASADFQPGAFKVYMNNPYTVHLEIEDPDLHEQSEPFIGDGGASLNAYAACLTLKVIF